MNGDSMRKYYLFVIRKDIYQIYQNKPDALFRTMRNLYQLQKEDFEYGISLYHQLCEPFDVERLERYFEEKYRLVKQQGKYRYHHNVMLIRPSRCIIQTQVNIPNIFIDFKCYNRLIFAIDFDNQDYFFLCNDYNKSK
jgi:hypothetical protein